MPELSRACQTLPAESLTSREEKSFCSFSDSSPLDVSFAPTATNQIKRISLYPQSLVKRKLKPGSGRAHKHSFTLVLYVQTESNRVLWAVTNRPTRAQERGLSSLAKWSTTHPIRQLPSGYGTQIQGQLTVHKNTFSYTTLARVVVRWVWWGNRFPAVLCLGVLVGILCFLTPVCDIHL